MSGTRTVTVQKADSARLQRVAERALALMRAEGFEHAQATASVATKDEINIAHNEPSLLRSTEASKLSLAGIVGGRKASTELADLEDGDALAGSIAALFADAASAPADDANAVSSGERARITHGPEQPDLDRVAAATSELLDFRAAQAPKMLIDECFVAHNRVDSHTLTSGGSELACRIGWYEASVFGTARDGKATSSFNAAGGTSDDLAGTLSARFGIADMLRDTERQVRTRPIGAPFSGDVVLMPGAVFDLVAWLLGQLGDAQLIAGTSIYQDKVGALVASPLLTLRSRFDAPGVAAVSADAFAAPPVDVLRAGRLVGALPTLYGSRKTGLPHVPTAASGWQIDAGAAPKAELVEGVARGALVGRLSMGQPASNGDFSGVIKNSFRVENGTLGDAIAETMISGNVAQMLRNVVAVSRERIDAGTTLLPWLRVQGLHFS